ncbi:MAG TPA: 7,8-didemethyl-8-hydroxy-5-deazariboflavin synthase CofG [Methanospirillum sp.]|uniref:7,8-didemethyl-8-hydroxy-5-deazariboflavin synthase CofG n=1 Tax=Methanospirillum sp. TaxID=45200 RepID=UPI002D06FFB5|nr:7,8-didemethyl-8-hydroxy-5-deazariboflavin synthase CofG [Methanospirillum sp.]HWQ64299.1 7,8-didemethyl-8-hydroxy-5-deazariboflavin synthase CofG [Methanospirillum sp.]
MPPDINPSIRQRSKIIHGEEGIITFSRNVFLPLTFVCQNHCGYCTFRQPPGAGCLTGPHQVQEILTKGQMFGCTEALFTFGERPELVPGFQPYLKALGHSTILDYCEEMSKRALEAGLLPHTNAGVLTGEEMERLKPLNASMGLMLETTADIPAHKGSQGKAPEVRIEMIEEAGRQKIPFTTGLLIGIGETREDRRESLQVISDLHRRHDHIQEIIIQNFCPKPGTDMAAYPGATTEIMKDTISLADEILPADISIQIPPNLADSRSLLRFGVTDLGGVSPVTPDYVNPEHPWPGIEELKGLTSGYSLRERLCIYPKYIRKGWYSPGLKDYIMRLENRITERGMQ